MTERLNLSSTTIVAPPASAEDWNRTRRARRGWHRCLSGIKLKRAGAIRLITLTHSPHAQQAELDIRESFRRLISALRKRWGLRAYIKVIEYTQRGQPHIHMIYRGRFVLQCIISFLWNEIHLSPIVWVNAIRRPEEGAHYIAKYLGKDPRARYSMSHDWLWVGVARDWRGHCKVWLGQGVEWVRVLEKWDRILASGHPEWYFWNELEKRLLSEACPVRSKIVVVESVSSNQLNLF